MFALTLDWVTILPFAAFMTIAAFVWWLLEALAPKKARAEERLDILKNPKAAAAAAMKGEGSRESITKYLEKATPAFAKALKPKDEASVSKLKQRLAYAGFRRETAPTIFLGLKIITAGVAFILGGGTVLFIQGFSTNAMMKIGICAAVGFFLPDVVVWFIGRKRKEAIFLSLPDTLDLLVVCVEAGLGLDQAMRRVSEEMKKSYRIICEELSICNFQLQMGRTRNEVLHELGSRTGVDDLRALASILIQADKFGSSVAQALRVQSDSMRTRRRQIAEEKAAKTAVQLIFPLVLFIFPGIFVVLVGPAGITMVRQMFPMMQG
jgi:tight adherence protein C